MPTKVETGSKKVKVLVVDDHPVVRKGIVHLINNQPDLVVCAETESGRGAIDVITATKPDMAIIDLTLQDTSGIEVIKNVRAMHPHLPMLVLSMHDETLYAERVLRAGAKGYIMKQEATENLLEAIRRVMSGEIYLSRKMETKLLRQLANGHSALSKSPIERLSDRELEVFQLLGHGQGTREIAERLRIGVKTVETHRMHIMEKLGVQSATELLKHAIQWVQSGQ